MTTDGVLRLDGDFYARVQEIMAQSRREAPVRRVESEVPTWLVTTYADVKRVLSGSGFTTDPRTVLATVAPDSTLARTLEASLASPLWGRYVLTSLLFLDGADHKRLRRLVGHAFTPAAVERLRPRIEALTDEVLATLPAAGSVDLVTSFAVHVPLMAIGELLGIPFADRRAFYDWTLVINGGTDPDLWNKAMEEATGYLATLVAERRAHPGDDLMSLMITARDENERLTEDELIAMALLISIAGHDTTVTLIANCVLALVRSPESMTALRENPDLLEDAVEELLRFDSPTNVPTARYALEPITLGGVDIPAGGRVLVSLLSANQDDRRFPDADRLELDRDTRNHLAFGHGMHYCVGAPLARLETRIALAKLLDRYPGMTLDTAPEKLTYRTTSLFHGLDELPIRLA